MPSLPPHPAPWPLHEGPATTALQAAGAFAAAHDSPFPHDLRAHLESGHFEPPPDNAILGPLPPRGPPNGLILHRGTLVARWGDTRQCDPTFSVAKSYLALLAGLALCDGLIDDLDAPVGASVDDDAFRGARNGRVTWRMLLNGTSEWEGALFGKSERIDRGRTLGTEGGAGKGTRALAEPGTHWEYNDVRVNALSLALLHRFGRPLPDIFAARVALPIGCSDEWEWTGYETSWVEVGGLPLQSVPGGSHWGGGVRMHAEDAARIGQLVLRDGVWEGRRLLPEGWVARMRTPCALNPDYGLLTWINGNGRWPSAHPDSFCFVGAGGNATWIDPAHDLVAVLRWTDPAALDPFMRQVTTAVEEAA